MDEAAFLNDYDPAAYERPSVAVDLVLLGVRNGAPAVLLIRRDAHPFAGHWALPGGFVGIAESLADAATRVLREKAGIAGAHLEQLYSFGAVERDPRMRIISIAWIGLLPETAFAAALAANPALMPAAIALPAGAASALTATADGAPLDLAFDHAAIIGQAITRLRGKLDYSDVGFALLPPCFTLRELQSVHEAILDQPFNKPAFRRRMLDKGWLAGTGTREQGTSYRPAELYRFQP